MNTLPEYEADDSPLSPAQIKQLVDKLDMNERIEKLAEQAEEWVSKNYPDAMDDNDDFHTQTMYKFAELIVQEWLEQLQYTVLDTQELRRDKSTDYQVGWEDGMFDAGETIKYIFGVEE